MPRVPEPITAIRASLLRMLAQLGPVRSENLTTSQKRLGTRLQRDGYAKWRARAGANRHSLANQELMITEAGRAALAAHES